MKFHGVSKGVTLWIIYHISDCCDQTSSTHISSLPTYGHYWLVVYYWSLVQLQLITDEGTFSVKMSVHIANLGTKEIWNAKIPILEIPRNASNVKRTFCKSHLKNKSHFSVTILNSCRLICILSRNIEELWNYMFMLKPSKYTILKMPI